MSEFNVSSMVDEDTVASMSPDMYKTYKAMMPDSSSTSHEGIVEAKERGLLIGKRVIIKWMTGEASKGVIKSYRYNTGGLYCGIRYPLSILRDDGEEFEYSLGQIELEEGG